MKRYLPILLLLAFVGGVSAEVVLTIPEAVPSQLGGNATVDYDRVRTLSIMVSPVDNSVVMQFELYASSDAARPPFPGTYIVRNGVASIEVEGVRKHTGVTLTNPQNNSVANAIDSHVAQVENSMISFGLVPGVQQ